MEERDIVIAGFGGQGVLFAGLLLAHAGLNIGLNVAWVPFYGPEMRGGTAGCVVVVSDEEIGSPVVARPHAAIVMNEPSLVKWAPRVRAGGTLVVNSSLTTTRVARTDIRLLEIPASELASEIGNDKVANMVAVGALVAATGLLPMEAVEAAIPETLGPGKERFVEPNRDAIRRGAELAVRHNSVS